jgi:DNA-binding response OmpR family regulator
MKKHLLVIEDNTDVRENLTDILELSGFQVTAAIDGKDGVEKALEVKPDLIVCDVMMPVLDGFGVLNILSKRTETYSIPFIFLTAKTEKEDIRRGMTLGADDYVTKPFYKDELLRVIDIRLKKAEKLSKNIGRAGSQLSSFIDAAKGFEELEKLSDNRKERALARKEVLFREGDYPRYFYRLKSGRIKLFKTNEYGKELILKNISPGDFFGYTPIIENSEYGYSAAASDKSELSLIPREDFISLLYSNRDVSAGFIKLLANNVSQKEEQLLSLAYNSVRKRTAEVLLTIYKQQNETGEINILREDLSRMVGTAKESVIRILTEFKRDKYIKIIEGSIEVLSKEELENISG